MYFIVNNYREVQTDKTDIHNSEQNVIIMDSLNKSLNRLFTKNFIKHLLLLTNFVSKLFEIRNTKYRITLISCFFQVFLKMIEENAGFETSVRYIEQPKMSMGTLSTVLTIEEQEVPGMDTVLLINNEHLDFNNTTDLKNKIANIYKRGSLVLRLPENLSEKISLVLFCFLKKEYLLYYC